MPTTASRTYPSPVNYRGVIADNQCLRLHYAACDLLVIPSRQHNLPNTGLEVQSCGLPVAGFRIGGLPDITEDHVSGALADPFVPASLAPAIHWVLADPVRHAALCQAAREQALRRWALPRMAASNSALYREVLAHPHA